MYKEVDPEIWDALGEKVFPAGIPADIDVPERFLKVPYPSDFSCDVEPYRIYWEEPFTQQEEKRWKKLVKRATRFSGNTDDIEERLDRLEEAVFGG